MANHGYYVTRPSGNVTEINADQVNFEHNHLLFLDENLRVVLVLHADEVRELVIDYED